MNKSLELIAGAAIAACAGLAVAQMSPPPPSTPPGGGTSPSTSPSTAPGGSASGTGAAAGGSDTFTKLDSDKDGMVSKKEASKNKDLTSKWDTLDTNKDGKLDQGEFAALESTAPTSGSAPKY